MSNVTEENLHNIIEAYKFAGRFGHEFPICDVALDDIWILTSKHDDDYEQPYIRTNNGWQKWPLTTNRKLLTSLSEWCDTINE